MSLTAFVEQIETGRFRATLGQPFTLVAEGDSKQEAIKQLKQMAKEKLSQGSFVELPIELNHPLLPFAGIWKDHPDMDEYLSLIEQQREEATVREQS